MSIFQKPVSRRDVLRGGRNLAIGVAVGGATVATPSLALAWCDVCYTDRRGKKQCKRIVLERSDIPGLQRGSMPTTRAFKAACLRKARRELGVSGRITARNGLWRAGGQTKRFNF